MVNKLVQNTISNGKVQSERQLSPAPVDMIYLNDVVQLMVNWLWYPYLPLGKLTAILGNPGEGKTYTVMNIIATCTNGGLLPGMEEPMEPVSVIYQTAEDGLGDTVKPRLIEAGADLTRVFSIDDTASLLTLSDERVERAIRENDVKLCVFDPLQAFLGANVDMNRANEVRSHPRPSGQGRGANRLRHRVHRPSEQGRRDAEPAARPRLHRHRGRHAQRAGHRQAEEGPQHPRHGAREKLTGSQRFVHRL